MTKAIINYVVEVILEAPPRRDKIRGLELTYQAAFLGRFTTRFRRVSA